MTLPVDSLVSRGFEPWDNWFELQKRSKRSNISGDINLIIQILPNESTPEEVQASDKFACNFPQHEYYKYLVKGFISYFPIIIFHFLF